MLAHRAGGAHCPSAPPTRPAIQRPTIIASTGGVLPVRLRLHATFGSTPDADGLEVQEGGPGPVSPAAAGAEAATAPSETAPAPQQQPFSWSKQWYAVAVADLTDPSRPAPLQLLGRSLVLWRDGAGDWRCFEDRCPHRAAPLSEGKIWEDGTLMCSYHGWRFQGGGACVRVPQAASPFAEQTACASQRSCASAHPVKQAQGLIFVWGEAGAEAAAEAELAPLPVDQLLAAAEAKGDTVKFVFPPYFRDLPYDWATLVENVVDPAHVPFSHHGVQGNRTKVKYGQYETTLVPDPTGAQIQVQHTDVFGPGHITFYPPGRVAYTNTKPDGTYSSFSIWCTPSAPGASRILAFITTDRSFTGVKGLIFGAIMALPQWLNHVVFRHAVLDGDSVFLHRQEHLLRERAQAGLSWKQSVYLPTRADTLVAAVRSFVEGPGGGGPHGPLHQARGYPPLISDRRALLNRYDQHTKSCVKCARALMSVQRARAAAGAGAAAAWAASLVLALQWAQARAAAAATAALPQVAVAAAAGAVLLTLAWRALALLEQRFFFVDYVHATR